MQNSIKDVVAYLEQNPFKTETQIQNDVWGFYRSPNPFSNNKKYADLLRRGLFSGKIERTKTNIFSTKTQAKYFYYLPHQNTILEKTEDHYLVVYKNKTLPYFDENLGKPQMVVHVYLK